MTIELKYGKTNTCIYSHIFNSRCILNITCIFTLLYLIFQPDMLAKTHPYNPLWAQLSDMYGAIGMPPRLARTIVTGKKVETIIKFLTVLSYFIR